MRTLVENGINTIDDLARSKVEEVRLLLNRSQTAAKKIIQHARRFPRFDLQVKESFSKIVKGKGAESDLDITIELVNSKSDLKKLQFRDSSGSAHNVAVLITTNDPKVRSILIPPSATIDGKLPYRPLTEPYLYMDPSAVSRI